MAGHAGGTPSASKRILGTDDPCIVTMQKVTPEPTQQLQLDSCRIRSDRGAITCSNAQMMRGKEGLLSLAQGIVFWGPPPEAMAAATAAVGGTASPAKPALYRGMKRGRGGRARCLACIANGARKPASNTTALTFQPPHPSLPLANPLTPSTPRDRDRQTQPRWGWCAYMAAVLVVMKVSRAAEASLANHEPNDLNPTP